MLTSILGKHLKSDFIIEILEEYNVDVVYEFDRLNENSPDIYWASAKSAGFLIRFNETQIADNVFIYMIAKDGGAIADSRLIDQVQYLSIIDAAKAFKGKKLKYTSSKTNFMGRDISWIKVEYDKYSVHYEFENQLVQITLSLIEKQ